MNKKNRLEKLLGETARKFELPYKQEADGLGGNVGLPKKDKLIYVGYSFDTNEDSYEFGAALKKVDGAIEQEIAHDIMKSPPVRGTTERIDERGRILTLGSRDGLNKQPDNEIQKFYMDDWAKVAEIDDQIDKIVKKPKK